LKLAYDVQLMRGELEAYKEDLVRSPAFTIFGEIFYLPEIYEFLINKIEHLKQIIDRKIEVLKRPAPENIFVPKFYEEYIDDLFEKLDNYFEPKEHFKNFLKGEQIEGKINFAGNQNQLAGIFILSKEYLYVKLGRHDQTFDYIKHNFLIKGKPIVTKQILSYLKEPGAIDRFGNLRDETKPGKANRKTFINISI